MKLLQFAAAASMLLAATAGAQTLSPTGKKLSSPEEVLAIVNGAPLTQMGGEEVESVPRLGGDDVETVPRTYYLYNEAHPGMTLEVKGQFRAVTYGTPQLQDWTTSPLLSPGNDGSGTWTGESITLEWTWDFNGSPRKVTVEVDRQGGQSRAEWIAEAAEQAAIQTGYYPPNSSQNRVSTPLGYRRTLFAGDDIGSVPRLFGGDDVGTAPLNRQQGTQGQTMEVSWLHDVDGEGPLQPITVTVRVEKKSAESTRGQAKRFRAAVEAAMEEFPPNVVSK